MSDLRARLVLFAGFAILLGALALVIVKAPRGRRNEIGSTTTAKPAVRAPKRPALPGADGTRLTGVVVDGAGVPVEGAEVSAELEQGAPDRALATKPAAIGSGSAAPATGSGSAAPPIASPTTGTDGRFFVEGLEPGRFRVRVTGKGLLAAELRMVPVPSDELRIVVARQVSIDGIVTDGGNPVPAAIVGIRGDAIGGTLETKTDTKGAFAVPNLPEGRYQVFAYRGALAARAMRVARLGAGPFSPIELRLEAAQNVVGRVVDRDEGIGLVAAIELRPVGDDQAPRYARSGLDGSFIIEGVPNGEWIADAFSPGYISPGGVDIEAGKGIPELALIRGATIEGRVLDGEGRPIEGATVRALTSEANPTEISAQVEQDQLRRFSGRTAAPAPTTSNFTADPTFIARGELGVTVGPIPPIPPPGAAAARPATIVDPQGAAAALAGEPTPLAIAPDRASIWITDREGRYRIRGLVKGKLSVLAVASGYAEARSREVSVTGAQVTSDVDITLTAGTYVFGKIADKRGAALPGAQIGAKPEVGAPLEGFADGDGMYRVGPLTGKVELVVAVYGHVDVHRSIELPATKGHAAERREDITLDVADAVLAGTLDDTAGAAIPGAHIEVINGAGQGRSAVVAADGTFSIDMLPGGPLRVRVTHPDYPIDELDTAASSTDERVRLRLPLGGQVDGVLIDDFSGNPLAGMTVDAVGPGRRMAEATSDDKGLWKLGPLKPGAWKIEMKLPGYLPFSREVDVPASLSPGSASVRDMRIDLMRGAVVGGTVRDRRGQRMGGARITVTRADGTGPTIDGEANAQGEFRINDCPTGELVITAVLGDAGGSTRASIRPGDEILGLTIELR